MLPRLSTNGPDVPKRRCRHSTTSQRHSSSAASNHPSPINVISHRCAISYIISNSVSTCVDFTPRLDEPAISSMKMRATYLTQRIECPGRVGVVDGRRNWDKCPPVDMVQRAWVSSIFPAHARRRRNSQRVVSKGNYNAMATDTGLIK